MRCSLFGEDEEGRKPPFGGKGNWVEAPDGATPVKRLGLLKLPCPSRTAVRFFVGAKKGTKKSPLPVLFRPVLADQESDQSSGGSIFGVWDALQVNAIDGRPQSCVSR